MHTLMVVAGGFLLLGMCLFVGNARSGPAGLARAALVFIPLWLIATGVNLWFGVAHAGYTVREELPIFLLLFGGLAAVALYLWRRFRMRGGPPA